MNAKQSQVSAMEETALIQMDLMNAGVLLVTSRVKHHKNVKVRLHRRIHGQVSFQFIELI